MTHHEVRSALSGRKIGVLVALSLMALGGCQTVRPVAQIVTPPMDLMADCPEPSSDASTNADLVNRFLDMRGALRRCNADKRALRTWSEEVKGKNPED